MASPLDMTWHPWYASYNNETKTVNDIQFIRNFKELIWHQEHIYQEGELIGEIFTAIDEEGYNLRKLVPCGEHQIMQTIANFNSIEDAQQFVLQAGGL